MLKIFFSTLAAVFLILIGALVFIWFKPDLIINEKNIRWGLQYAPEDLKISWKTLDIRFENPRWYEKRIALDAGDLCIQYQILLDTCLSELVAEAYISFEGFRFSLLEVTEVKVHATHLKVLLPKSEEKEVKKDSSVLPRLSLPPFAKLFPQKLDLSLIRDFAIIVDDFSIQLSPEALPYRGKISLEREILKDRLNELNLNLKASANQDDKLQVQTSLRAFIDSKNLNINGNANIKIPAAKVAIPIDLKWQNELTLSSAPVIEMEKLTLAPKVSLKWNQREILLTLEDVKNKNIWRGAELGMRTCILQAELSQKLGHPENIDLKCSLLARPLKKIKYIDTVDTELHVRIKTVSFGEDISEKLSLEGEVELSGATALVQGNIEALGNISLQLKPHFKITELRSHLLWDLEVPEFALWKDLTERTAFAIPAPLHVLKGPITLKGSAVIPEKDSALNAKAELKTILKSERQKFYSSTQVQAELRNSLLDPKGLKVAVQALLEEIVLEAPPLRLEAPPQVLPDGRFKLTRDADLQKKKKKEEAKKPTFPIEWSVEVKNEKPILVSNQIFKTPLPFAVDIQVDQNLSPQGKASLLKYPFEIFKKAATVERIDVILHPNSQTPELSGKVTYKNPEVDIDILLLGSTAKPRVEFESDPPLNRQQIISVLLFNKSLDELNEEEVSSATNISHAMSDGAFGLFSLIFLSSTPIQSIGYDPVSQNYTARLKIDDSTTLSIGSNFDERRQFTVRRRLGGPWSVRTELRQTEEQPDVVLTLLEWLKRF